MPAVIHKRQRAILDFITQYIQTNGFAPTLREIADGVGLQSMATVHEHIERLIKKRILKKTSKVGTGRTIKLLHRPVEMGKGAPELPVLGYIAAGEPIEPYSHAGTTFQVSPSMLSGKHRSYVLQVRGDSMVEDGILDGDFVIIEEDSDVHNGDIVVALLENGLATLKRFFKEETRVRLQPANSKMAPIFVGNVTIQGKVKGVVRKYF